MSVRLFYIDDSGAVDTGYVVYSWVEVEIRAWREGLHTWLDWRHSIQKRHRIPVMKELHATRFIGGRDDPSLDPEWNRSKANRRFVAEEVLALLGDTACLRFGTVFRRTDARRREYHQERKDVYLSLVNLLDERLAQAGELGIVVMDGDGTDPSYVSAHRSLRLSTRSIIEDPVFQHSHRSHWVQMADLVAYVTYQHLLRHPGKAFAWSWYEQHLAPSDVMERPTAV